MPKPKLKIKRDAAVFSARELIPGAILTGEFTPNEVDRLIRAVGLQGFALEDIRPYGRGQAVFFRRGRTCRFCGCGEKSPCVSEGPSGKTACSWVDDHTCSHCA